jgi:hypothetical protein
MHLKYKKDLSMSPLNILIINRLMKITILPSITN